ncbi:NACHT, LRR and PYD domains-containing protein 12-like [Glandiceps talaboti]
MTVLQDDPAKDEMKLIKMLKRNYVKHFKNHIPIPWNERCKLNLEEVYTQLEVKEVKRGNFQVGQCLEDVQSIFKSVHDGPGSTNRICMEGAPAIGKSTLCGKIAYDWAQGKLKKYNIVFFL